MEFQASLDVSIGLEDARTILDEPHGVASKLQKPSEATRMALRTRHDSTYYMIKLY